MHLKESIHQNQSVCSLIWFHKTRSKITCCLGAQAPISWLPYLAPGPWVQWSFAAKERSEGTTGGFSHCTVYTKHSLEFADKSFKDLYYAFHKSVEPIKLEIFETFLVLIIKSITLPLKPPDIKRYSYQIELWNIIPYKRPWMSYK